LARPASARALAGELAECASTPAVYTADRATCDAVLGFRFKRGIVAIGERPPDRDGTWLWNSLGERKHVRLLVLDAVHDPVNVGTLIRTARCLGVTAVALGPGSGDPWYRRSIRVSVGHVFHLPVVSVPSVPELLAHCRSAGLSTFAAHRGPGDEPLPKAVQGSWALVLGNEDRGVDPATVAAVDHRLAIPMAAGVDSLNVAAAGAITCQHLIAADGQPP
jgi:tRNA G18 (ribose-2'-O)-methylase SpoU